MVDLLGVVAKVLVKVLAYIQVNNGFYHHPISSLCQGRVNKLQQDFVEPLY